MNKYKNEKRIPPEWRRVLVLVLLFLVIGVCIFGYSLLPKKNSTFRDSVTDQIAQEMSDNSLIFSGGNGRRTVVDFQEVVLGLCTQKAEFVVHDRPVEETVSIASEGLGGWRWTSSYQNIKYKGHAEYMVDLSQLTEEDFTVNNETKELTVRIPYVVLKPILIPAEDIEFGEVDKGWFGPKTIKLTPEEIAQVEITAGRLMKTKLIDENEAAQANEAAKAEVGKLLSAVVHSVDPAFTVVIVQ